jgi:hypothetical protein
MDCRPIETHPVEAVSKTGPSRVSAFVSAVEKGQREQKKAIEVRVRIDMLIERLENSEDDETRRIVESAQEAVKGTMTTGQLEVIANELETYIPAEKKEDVDAEL